jgi:hypothetical protein
VLRIKADWGAIDTVGLDPFGNAIRFCEPIKPDGAA